MIRSLLNIPFIYSAFQKMVKTERYELMLSNLLGDTRGLNVLDFGCGPGDLVTKFSGSKYLGVDPLTSCVAEANSKIKKFGIDGKAIVGDHTALQSMESRSFDLIIAIGVLHHIPDAAAYDFICEASRLLNPTTGRLITLDPCRFEAQSKLSKFLVGRDRGRYVRNDFEYLAILASNFPEVKSKQNSGVLRMPYDLLSIVGVNSLQPSK